MRQPRCIIEEGHPIRQFRLPFEEAEGAGSRGDRMVKIPGSSRGIDFPRGSRIVLR